MAHVVGDNVHGPVCDSAALHSGLTTTKMHRTWLNGPISAHGTTKVHALVHDATCLLGTVAYQAFNEFMDECSRNGWHPLLLELAHAFLLT